MPNLLRKPSPAEADHVDSTAALSCSRLHAACGARHEKAVLLLGGAGSGKSDLLLRLIDRGFMLVADDQVLIDEGCASPPPALAGLLEVRGLGLLRLPHRAPVALRLVLALDDAAMSEAVPDPGATGTARLPAPARHRLLQLPLLRIEPFTASAAQRIEIALDCLDRRSSLDVGALS